MDNLIEYKRDRLLKVWGKTPKEVKSLTFDKLGFSQQRVFYALNKSNSERTLDLINQALKNSLIKHESKVSQLIQNLY